MSIPRPQPQRQHTSGSHKGLPPLPPSAEEDSLGLQLHPQDTTNPPPQYTQRDPHYTHPHDPSRSVHNLTSPSVTSLRPSTPPPTAPPSTRSPYSTSPYSPYSTPTTNHSTSTLTTITTLASTASLAHLPSSGSGYPYDGYEGFSRSTSTLAAYAGHAANGGHAGHAPPGLPGSPSGGSVRTTRTAHTTHTTHTQASASTPRYRRQVMFHPTPSTTDFSPSPSTPPRSGLGAGSAPSTPGSGSAPLAKKRSSGQLLMGFGKGLGLGRMGSVMRRGSADDAGGGGAGASPASAGTSGGGGKLRSVAGSVRSKSRSRKSRQTIVPLAEEAEDVPETEAKGPEVECWAGDTRGLRGEERTSGSTMRPMDEAHGDEGISRPFNVEHELHVSPDLADLPPAWLLSLRAQGLSEQDLMLITSSRQKQHAAGVRALPLRGEGGKGGEYMKAPLSAPAGRFLGPPFEGASEESTSGDGDPGGLLQKSSFETDQQSKSANPYTPSPPSEDGGWGRGAGKEMARDAFDRHFGASLPGIERERARHGLDSYPVSAAESSDAGEPETEPETDSSAISTSVRATPSATPRKSKRLSDQLRGFKELKFGLGLGEEDEWGKSILGAAWDLGGGGANESSDGGVVEGRSLGRTGGLGSITEASTSPPPPPPLTSLPSLPTTTSPPSATSPTSPSPRTPRPFMPPPPAHSPPPERIVPAPLPSTPEQKERRVPVAPKRPVPLPPVEDAGRGVGGDDRFPRSPPPPARPRQGSRGGSSHGHSSHGHSHSSHSHSQSFSSPDHPRSANPTNNTGPTARPIPALIPRKSSESFGVHYSAQRSGSSVELDGLDGGLVTPALSTETRDVRGVREGRGVRLGGGSGTSDEAGMGGSEEMIGEEEGEVGKSYADSGYGIDLGHGGDYSGDEEGGTDDDEEEEASDSEEGFERYLAGGGKGVSGLGRGRMGYPPSPPQTATSGHSAPPLDGRDRPKGQTGVHLERLTTLVHSPSLPEIGISLPVSAAPTTPFSRCSTPPPPLPITRSPHHLSPRRHPPISPQTSYSTFDSTPYHPDPEDPLAGLDTASRDERASIALSLMSNRTSNSMHSLSELREATVRVAYKGLMGGQKGEGLQYLWQMQQRQYPSVGSPGHSPSYPSHRYSNLQSPSRYSSPRHSHLGQDVVEELEHEHDLHPADADADADAEADASMGSMSAMSVNAPRSAAGDEIEEGGMSVVFEYGGTGTEEEGARDALDALGEAAARIARDRG
ncbi:hypothetical protein IAT38_006102 [Cryptococcus sp. DSM 104549]